jgi:hypothetical protein
MQLLKLGRLSPVYSLWETIVQLEWKKLASSIFQIIIALVVFKRNGRGNKKMLCKGKVSLGLLH